MSELFVPDPSVATDPELRVPSFSLVVSAESTGGWRSAAVVRDVASPAYYLRSISVSWPFIIARPRPSTRQRERRFRPDQLSPARTSPVRKLVVNWGWQPVDGATEQLRFYVRRLGPMWLWPNRRLSVRLRVKQQAPPQRRYLLEVSSEPIDWRATTAAEFVGHASSSPVRG